MKIGIDISQIIYGTGVSVYTKNLVKNLLEIDNENEYVLFGGSGRRKQDLEKFVSSLKGNYQQKIVFFPPSLADFIWNRLHVLSIEKFIGKVDIFHSSDWTQPPSKAIKVTTVHDLTPLRYPNLADPKIVSVHRAVLKWIIKEVDRIIVPSQATLEDLVLLNVKRNKIRVIAEASDPFFKKVSSDLVVKVKNKYQIKKDFLLSVGVGERKNTNRIIEAFKALGLEDTVLVFVGRRGSHESEDNIKFLDYVSDFDLRSLYSGAQALVYPSIYEGFGLSILQAYSCRCPVVTSNISSMPEVAGTAAVLVDPFDITSISDGILKAIKNHSSLIEKGLARSREFNWEKTAKETLRVYKELA